MIFIVASCLLAVAYVLLMLLYRRGWRHQPVFSVHADFKPVTSISVIIAARNEATHIEACIRSICAQAYPQHLLEIIVVDDHSEDQTAELVEAFGDPRIRCIRLADHLASGEKIIAYKKKALATGVMHSRGELIITTDADCAAQEHWLRSVAAMYEQEQPAMIVAPVDFTCDGSLVQLFQSLDFMSMQGITGAAHRLQLGNMSNGANLAFSRAAFEQVNGYAGTEHLASGDDYLLTTKMQDTFPGRISYLKTEAAIMKTAPQPDWGSFFQQRIRWASKSGKYKDRRLTAVLLLIYLYNVSFAVTAFLVFRDKVYLLLAGIMFLTKLGAELYYLWPVARFFRKRSQLWIFPFFQPMHILYIITAGFLGFAGVYRWKGRSVK